MTSKLKWVTVVHGPVSKDLTFSRGERGAIKDMRDGQNIAEYRSQAAFCLEVAQQISVREDRKRMMEKAQQWLAPAKKAEAEER